MATFIEMYVKKASGGGGLCGGLSHFLSNRCCWWVTVTIYRMADLISVPLKKPSEVELEKPLKNLIQSRYSTADKPEDCDNAVTEFAKLRNNAIWRAFEKYESSLEVIYRYDSYYNKVIRAEFAAFQVLWSNCRVGV